jgi:hypothetical protein
MKTIFNNGSFRFDNNFKMTNKKTDRKAIVCLGGFFYSNKLHLRNKNSISKNFLLFK